MHQDLATNKEYTQKLNWIAVHHDNSIMTGKEHSSEKIDRRQLKSMMIVDDDNNTILTQHFRPGQRPIYRTRTVMRPGVGVLDRIHILGWYDKDLEHVAFIAESDKSIELGYFIPSGSPEAINKPWYYEIHELETDLVVIEPPNHTNPDVTQPNQDTAPACEKSDESTPLDAGQIQSS